MRVLLANKKPAAFQRNLATVRQMSLLAAPAFLGVWGVKEHAQPTEVWFGLPTGHQKGQWVEKMVGGANDIQTSLEIIKIDLLSVRKWEVDMYCQCIGEIWGWAHRQRFWDNHCVSFEISCKCFQSRRYHSMVSWFPVSWSSTMCWIWPEPVRVTGLLSALPSVSLTCGEVPIFCRKILVRLGASQKDFHGYCTSFSLQLTADINCIYLCPASHNFGSHWQSLLLWNCDTIEVNSCVLV